MMILVLGDLSMWGYTAGAVKYYSVLWTGSDNVYAQETVMTVSPWDGSGTRCTFYTPVDRAYFATYNLTYPSIPYLAHAYYDGTYLVDFGGSSEWPDLGGAYLRILKFPLTVGDTWPALDTCHAFPGERFPIPDEDLDGIPDSIYYDTSYATTTYLNGDTVEVYVYPMVAVRLYTASGYSGDTFYCCNRFTSYYYLRFRYVRGIGMVFLSIDSILTYMTYTMIDTSTGDTMPVPPYLIGRYINYQVWEYTTTAVAERPGENSPFILRKEGVLRTEEDVSVYSSDGRLVIYLKGGDAIRLKPGIYFIRSRKGVSKVVVR